MRASISSKGWWGFLVRRRVLAASFCLLCYYLLTAPQNGILLKSPTTTAQEQQCRSVMQALVDSVPSTVWPPPCPLDPILRKAYEGPNSSMPVTKDWCLAQRYEGAGERVLDWNKEYVEGYCAKIATGEEIGSYRDWDRQSMIHAMAVLARTLTSGPPSLASKVGMVMGSERPWVECIALNLGASIVWTFEYGKVVSTHPRLKAKPYKDIASDFIEGRAQPLDWIASYSSLEHSGLGRYGDPMNPEGDAEAMQQAWCMLKPGGVMLLAFGMTCQNEGFIEFNAHRVYGFQRLAHVCRGFEVLGFVARAANGCNPQDPPDPREARVVILRKPLSGRAHLTADDFAAAAHRGSFNN